MTIHLDRGPFIYIPDKLHPGSYKMVKNPDWDGELPDIITFTDFLRWNYTLDYGRYIRDSFDYGILPLPWEASRNAKIKNVLIINGYYDRIDRTSFDMYVICEVYFNVNGSCLCQEYVVYGRYESGGKSDFLRGIDMYDGKRIKLSNPLDDCLVPIMNKKKFRKTAKMILKEYYPYDIDAPGWINVYALAKAMGLKIRYAYLSRNTKVKVRSKLIHDRRDTIVYNEYGKERKISITEPTILLDESISDTVEEYSAIVHECVHAYLHNLFYELQSLYRRIINVNIPEFNDYNFSKTHRTSVKWMEVQANSITRYIQMPEEQAEEAILSFFDRKVGEPDWAEYRQLIDDIKGKFRTARNTAKRIIVELGWKDVRGVYVYNVAGYEEGKARWTKLFGYEKNEDGEYQVVPEQAEVVRKVFSLYEHGESIDKISKYLQRHLIPTPECGKEWSVGTVRKMLMNERYCGDILLQKTICESHITHKQIKNDMTEVPSYYIEDHHPAIISRKQFQRCKEIFEMRRTPHPDMPGTYNNQYPLGDKLICPNCGSRLFKRSMKIQEPGSGWSCEVGEHACRQFIIREYIVDKALLNAYNTLDVGLVENKLDSPKFGTAAETMLEFKREYPEMKKVGYWWVDDLIDHIEFGKHSRKTKELIALEVKGTPDTADRTMKVYWKCGLVTTVPSCVEYDKELPSRVAEIYYNQQKRIADRNKRKGRPKK